MKAKILRERDGYKYEGRSEDGKYFWFTDIYANRLGYRSVKFITTDGQVFFGNPDKLGDLERSNSQVKILSDRAV